VLRPPLGLMLVVVETVVGSAAKFSPANPPAVTMKGPCDPRVDVTVENESDPSGVIAWDART
jgi:hypothetical protein